MLKRLLGLAAMVWMTAACVAQNAAIEQVRGRPRMTSLDDIGDLKMFAEDRGEVVELTGRQARPFTIRSGVSTSIDHQSNAPLLGSGHQDDWLSLSAIEAGIHMPLGETFSVDFSMRTDVARYFHLENISYWGPSATALLDFRPRIGWPRAFVGGQLYRYDLIETGAKITDAGGILTGLDHAWTLNGGRSGISTGYQFSRYWASPLGEDRASHALFATVTHQIAGPLHVQASYVWQYTGFENQPRHDSRHMAALGLIYAPKGNFSVRLYANFVRNESSDPSTDYENFTSGVGGMFSLRF